METCKRLQRLRLYGIPLQLVSMRLLASGVSACRNMLHAVSLSDCGVTDAGFKVLVAALRDVPPLSSLRISGGRLTDASAKSLSDLIQTNSLRQTEWVWSSQLCAGRSADEYGSIGCLTILELPNNQLGDVAADALVPACSHCLTRYQCWCCLLPLPYSLPVLVPAYSQIRTWLQNSFTVLLPPFVCLDSRTVGCMLG